MFLFNDCCCVSFPFVSPSGNTYLHFRPPSLQLAFFSPFTFLRSSFHLIIFPFRLHCNWKELCFLLRFLGMSGFAHPRRFFLFLFHLISYCTLLLFLDLYPFWFGRLYSPSPSPSLHRIRKWQFLFLNCRCAVRRLIVELTLNSCSCFIFFILPLLFISLLLFSVLFLFSRSFCFSLPSERIILIILRYTRFTSQTFQNHNKSRECFNLLC